MTIERLRRIIEYSERNRAEIESKIKNFYAFSKLNNEETVLNVLQITRKALTGKDYLVLEIPFADKEIGALCYKGEGLGYIVLNTSLPRVNVNFAICHEVYHAFFPDERSATKVEFVNNHYYEDEEEFAANLFAGMLLMPEESYRLMYDSFKAESDGDEFDTILRLMNYYQVPYMAALIRCYELGLPKESSVPPEYLTVSQDTIRKRLSDLWLDETILDATKRDVYPHMEKIVEQVGEENLQGAYLNERTLKKVLQNMRSLYSEIKGE